MRIRSSQDSEIGLVQTQQSVIRFSGQVIPHSTFNHLTNQNSELRTFASCLEEIDHNAQMHSMILDRVADLRHVVQLLPPIDFEAGPVVGQDIPPEPGAHAGERVGEAW